MPSSVPYAVPIIANVARQLRPRRVLDVGVGFGKYGFLLREYTDIWEMASVDDYRREHWKTVIEGIDATPDYITPLHEYVYDKIHIGDVTTLIDSLGTYDVIIMGDVLEHFDKPAGEVLLDKLYAHTNQCLLLTFPPNCRANDSVIGNPYEAHRSAWNRKDFRRFRHAEYKLLEGRAALVAITKSPHTAPLLTACFGARRREGWKGLATSILVRTLGAVTASRLATWFAGEPRILRA